MESFPSFHYPFLIISLSFYFLPCIHTSLPPSIRPSILYRLLISSVRPFFHPFSLSLPPSPLPCSLLMSSPFHSYRTKRMDGELRTKTNKQNDPFFPSLPHFPLFSLFQIPSVIPCIIPPFLCPPLFLCLFVSSFCPSFPLLVQSVRPSVRPSPLPPSLYLPPTYPLSFIFFRIVQQNVLTS